MRFYKIAIAPTVVLASTMAFGATAQDAEATFGQPVRKVSYGAYVRLEFAATNFADGAGDWEPPGFPSDPDVYFDVGGEAPGAGTVAFGFDRSNGWRGDISVSRYQNQAIDATWSYTVPSVPGPHADITTDLSTTAIMANVFYSPTAQGTGGAKFQPFITGGLGFAVNTVGDWTRTNPAAVRPVRVFEGDQSTSLAWSLGAGFSYDISGRTGRPVFLDVTYRYNDFGTAKGGKTPLPGNGSSKPIKPFSFDNNNHAIGVGLRIPLQRM